MKDKRIVKYIRMSEIMVKKINKLAKDGRRSFVQQVEMLIEKGLK